ncbi:MAG: hypothetical protein WCI02_15065 [Planctomycetota bacterium]|jgi:hypothetical protein
MNVFEVLFIFLFLASLVTLVTATGLAVFRRRAVAGRLLRRYSICLVVYLAIVLLVSPFSPRTVVHLGDPLCFDDWCITIQSVVGNEAQGYVVTASLFSRARGAPQRETGVVLYLTDSSEVRYDSVNSEDDIPFDIRLQPNESVEVSRTYRLPSGTMPTGVVVAHERGFPITWFIIGDGPFKKPPIVLLHGADGKLPNNPLHSEPRAAWFLKSRSFAAAR